MQPDTRRAHRIHRPRRTAGFTLIEILVVVIVLAILAATIIPQFTGTRHDAKVSMARGNLATLENQLEQFNLHMDRYPTQEEGLRVLLEPPVEGAERWRGPYVKELRPDPWGNPYQYRTPGLYGSLTYDLWSNGGDGKEGGEGQDKDVVTWQETETR